MKKSLGWVAINKESPELMGGHNARCKVYGSRGMAIGCQRGKAYIDPDAPWSWKNLRPETDEEVLAQWHIVETFVELPE